MDALIGYLFCLLDGHFPDQQPVVAAKKIALLHRFTLPLHYFLLAADDCSHKFCCLFYFIYL